MQIYFRVHEKNIRQDLIYVALMGQQQFMYLLMPD